MSGGADRSGPGCLNRFSASISGASAGVRLPSGRAAERSRLDRGSRRQGSHVAFGDCTTTLENAHGTEFRELLYPWHPWFGLRVGIHAAIDKPDGVVFRCSLSGLDADRWLEVPAWMFDRSACGRVRAAADACVELAALTALAALLRQVLNDHLASSNAPLSGVLGVSREPNRGELHATPDQAAAGRRSRSTCSQKDREGEPEACPRGPPCRRTSKPH